MTVIQCDKCGTIIYEGFRTRIDYGDSKVLGDEGIKYSKLLSKEVDLCEKCFSELKSFFKIK